MNRRRSKSPQSFHMCAAAISLVMRKAVLGITFIEFHHHRVTRDFSYYRGGSNRDTKLIAFYDGSLNGQLFENRVHLKQFCRDLLIPVDEQTIRRRPQGAKGLDHCKQTRLENIDPIDLLNLNDTHTPA